METTSWLTPCDFVQDHKRKTYDEANPTFTTEDICTHIDRVHAAAVQASTQSIDRSFALKISAALELVVADLKIQIDKAVNDKAVNASSLLQVLATVYDSSGP